MFLYVHFAPGPDYKVRYGDWAVVTGATDGIGLGYAKRLASRGVNVVLVSRSQEKLNECSKEIIAKYKVQVKTIAVDMSQDYEVVKAKVESELKGITVGTLVNNVGISYDHAMFLTEIPDERVRLIIHLNCAILTMMTKICLPGMVERRKGAIINVSSAAGIMAIGNPMYEVYSGSKAYVDFFSRSLNIEMKNKGIRVECHCPYFVPSKLSKIRKTSLFCPHANVYAESSLTCFGKGPVTVVPYWGHAVQHFLYHAIPTCILEWQTMKMHMDIYKRAMKKKQMKQE